MVVHGHARHLREVAAQQPRKALGPLPDDRHTFLKRNRARYPQAHLQTCIETQMHIQGNTALDTQGKWSQPWD